MSEIGQAQIDAVVRAAGARGVQLQIDHDRAEVTIDGVRLERPWVYRPRGSRRSDPREDDTFPQNTLVLTDRMTGPRATEARRVGAWFADADGRLYVRAPGVLVDIGDLPTRKHSPAGRVVPKATNLMSPARAQVVFSLLAWPEMTKASVRVLARTAGASVGVAQEVLAALAADRYLTVGHERLIHVGELLDRWAGAFGLGLGRRLELARFSGPPEAQAWADAGHAVYVGGEAALPDELKGGGLTLYVPEMDVRAVAGAGWRRAEPGAPADVVVRRQFWSAPNGADVPSPGTVGRAPLPLVYADLVASGEPRQQEVAGRVRGQVLGLHAR